MKKLTKEQQKELAEILAELAKELGLSRRELFSKINEKIPTEELGSGNN